MRVRTEYCSLHGTIPDGQEKEGGAGLGPLNLQGKCPFLESLILGGALKSLGVTFS